LGINLYWLDVTDLHAGANLPPVGAAHG